MSLASDKLETIREQVQYHLDHAEQKKLSPERERSLKDQIKTLLHLLLIKQMRLEKDVDYVY